MGARLGVSFLNNDDELNKLPSKKKYTNFNNGHVGCNHVYFYELVKSHLKQEEWKKDVSNEILKALCYVYNTYNQGNFNSDDCYYLYHWLNDIIYNNITYQLHYISVITVLEFLLKSNEGFNICDYKEYNINNENYRNIKKLFDFSKDYDDLAKYFSTGQKICNSDFKNYLDEHIRIYNEFKNKCKNLMSDNATCIFFHKYFQGKTEKDLTKWKFTLEGSSHIYAAQEEKHTILGQSNEEGVKTLQIHALIKSDKEKTALENVNQSAYINADKEDLNHQLLGHSLFTIERPILSAIIDNSGTPSDSTSKSMVIPALGIGFSIFSIILCKVIINFTPVGYWLKKALLGKSKSKRNIMMDRNIIEDYSIPEVLDSPRRLNIIYRNI
ncbi:variable surface protein [Plasmodium gonderi]|uniref:Variable surface protein n=1 Tax=Plasmodium gonderi TaxID=77519 RepID=A0A1Y1JSM9_PLAGO|nr:variable surface protein [Plasmodium gonderi]GAW84448.1 variable surface protein [Plasmodium gonderi]